MYERSYGYKYDEQNGKTTADIAKLMRRDIKQAVDGGLLPGAPVRYSVKTETYSGGASINITVQGWPAAWQDCDGYVPGSEDRVHGAGRDLCRNYFCEERLGLLGENRPGAERHQTLTAEARAAEMTLQRIHGAYNHDGSDSMTDHFDVNYYGGVKFETPRDAQWRADEKAKRDARRATTDSATAGGEVRRVVVYGSKGKQTVHDGVTVDGRTRLVCGATLWRHSMIGDATGRELTCSRCAKRAAQRVVSEPAGDGARVMHTYDVMIYRAAPGGKRIVEHRTTADVTAARELIAALYPGAMLYRPTTSLDWMRVRDDGPALGAV